MAARMRCRLLTLLACIAFCSSALAGPSLDDMLRPERMTLPNGFQVWMKSRPGSGSIYLVAGVKVGIRYETLRQRGLVHFVEHLVFAGTSRRSQKDLEQDVMARGGQLGGTAGADVTWIWLDVPDGQLEFGLRWLSEVLFDSAFPPDRVDVERKILVREQEAESYGGLWWRIERAAFDANSMVQGPRDLKWELRNYQRGLRRADLLGFYRAQYVPNNIILALVGDFDAVAARKQLQQIMGPIRRGGEPGRGARTALVWRGRRVAVAGFSGLRSSSMMSGYVVPRCSHEDGERLGWLCWLASVRAADRIREAEGRSYVVHASALYHNVNPEAEDNIWTVHADCRHWDLGRVERIAREELERLRSGPISQREMRMIRAGASTYLRGIAESNRGLAWSYVQGALVGSSPDRTAKALQHVTAPELQALARKCLNPERALVAYYRPWKTPKEIAAGGALFALLSLCLVIFGRRRNSKLTPPVDRVEELLVPARNTPRFIAARIANEIVLGGIGVACLVWLPWKLSEYLFTHAMFRLDLALFLAYFGPFMSALVAASFTQVGRRVVVSTDGVLLVTAGFHVLLRPHRIRSVEMRRLSMWRAALDPRVWVLGGDKGRWVAVKGPLGLTVYLAVDDPEGFAERTRAYLATPRVSVGATPSST